MCPRSGACTSHFPAEPFGARETCHLDLGRASDSHASVLPGAAASTLSIRATRSSPTPEASHHNVAGASYYFIHPRRPWQSPSVACFFDHELAAQGIRPSPLPSRVIQLRRSEPSPQSSYEDNVQSSHPLIHDADCPSFHRSWFCSHRPAPHSSPEYNAESSQAIHQAPHPAVGLPRYSLSVIE
jgi:hypothetical protein